MLSAYRRSHRRLLLLDYDGTLVPFAPRPELAVPGAGVIELLRDLSSIPGNDVVVISGRTRQPLQQWFGALDVTLVAEHGAWLRRRGNGRWMLLGSMRTRWKPVVTPVLEGFVDRVPGSHIEEKEFSLAWHYRNADPAKAAPQVRELLKALEDISARAGIDVIRGHKVVEVKDPGISKGRAALHLLRGRKYGFVLAIGDDLTDEAMFCALPHRAYSIRVGRARSHARFALPSQKQVFPLLRMLDAAGCRT